MALKISFANSIAKLADKAGADVTEVMSAVGADKRIGKAFLNAGRGYGGGCFPKDVSGLIASAVEHGVELNIMDAATELNKSMPGYIVNKAMQQLGGSLENKHIAVLGLAFKAGTSDTRRSPAITLANLLVEHGATVTAYDPEAATEARRDLNQAISLSVNIEDTIKNVEAIFIATDWPEFINYPLTTYAAGMGGNLLIDCMNRFDKHKVQAAGLQYLGVGR